MPANSYDSTFEKTFSDLAFSNVKEKAPALMDYLVGFQVLDANDDQTKATGIFGFRVGTDWVYVPVLFCAGELKVPGMYLKSQDLFVPLTEAWVYYLLNRKPYRIGEASDVPRSQLANSGADMRVFLTSPARFGKVAEATEFTAESPDFYIRPAGKQVMCWGSHRIQTWAEPAKNLLSQLPTGDHYKEAADRLDLPTFIASNGPRTARALVGSMVDDPEFGNAVLAFYEPQALTAIRFNSGQIKEARVSRFGKEETRSFRVFPDGTALPVIKQAEGPRLPDVRITSLKDTTYSNIPGLSESDRERLMQGEILVEDHRKQTSKLYRAQLTATITSPSEPGLYDLLARDGSTFRALILHDPVKRNYCAYSGSSWLSSPKSNTERVLKDSRDLLVINTSGPGVGEFSADRLMGKRVYTGSFKYDPYFKQLSTQGTIKEGGRYVLVMPDGQCTRAFRVQRKSTVDGQTTLWFSTGLRKPKRDSTGPEEYVSDRDTIILTGRPGTKIEYVGETCFVPEDARVVNVEIESDEKWQDNYGLPTPGDFADVQKQLVAGHAATPLKLYSTGTEYQLTVGNMKSAGYLSRIEALRSLMLQHGLDGDNAQALLKEADSRRVGRGLVTYVNPYPILDERLVKGAALDVPAPRVPDSVVAPVNQPFWSYDDPVFGGQVMPPQTQNVAINALRPDWGQAAHVYNPDPRLDRSLTQIAQEASSSGQKEIFDAAAVGGLIRTLDVNDQINKYLGDMILGMDRVGRILFLFYQHNDQFTDRYGQNDQLEMEESLKNTFQYLGELILDLKEKGVAQSPSFNHMGTKTEQQT